jgi:hypothetical protein
MRSSSVITGDSSRTNRLNVSRVDSWADKAVGAIPAYASSRKRTIATFRFG